MPLYLSQTIIKSIENNNTMSIMKLKRREEYEKQNYNIKREDA